MSISNVTQIAKIHTYIHTYKVRVERHLRPYIRHETSTEAKVLLPRYERWTSMWACITLCSNCSVRSVWQWRDQRSPKFIFCNMSTWNQTVVCSLPEDGCTLVDRYAGCVFYLTSVDYHCRGTWTVAEWATFRRRRRPSRKWRLIVVTAVLYNQVPSLLCRWLPTRLQHHTCNTL